MKWKWQCAADRAHSLQKLVLNVTIFRNKQRNIWICCSIYFSWREQTEYMFGVHGSWILLNKNWAYVWSPWFVNTLKRKLSICLESMVREYSKTKKLSIRLESMVREYSKTKTVFLPVVKHFLLSGLLLQAWVSFFCWSALFLYTQKVWLNYTAI